MPTWPSCFAWRTSSRPCFVLTTRLIRSVSSPSWMALCVHVCVLYLCFFSLGCVGRYGNSALSYVSCVHLIYTLANVQCVRFRSNIRALCWTLSTSRSPSTTTTLSPATLFVAVMRVFLWLIDCRSDIFCTAHLMCLLSVRSMFCHLTWDYVIYLEMHPYQHTIVVYQHVTHVSW